MGADALVISALIMAGGRGSRMGLPTEKPMLPFLGKPLLDWVAQAVKSASKVGEFYVITSPNTPQTELHCQKMGYRFVRTDANGYHNDLRQAVTKLGWMGPILTMPSDVPAITGAVLDWVVGEFEVCGKDFLAVFVPIEKRLSLGLSISSTDEYGGVWYAVSGVNVINGAKVLGEGKVETAAIITEETEVVLNVNTTTDLEIARQLMQKNQP
ncbi:MAG: NTP transferase domain-containing protein [Candidatus Bathyarchaeota archaeon]|nr:NTP transferase domain-containing protein [Candidatus Bathyarchaeota archaeon]